MNEQRVECLSGEHGNALGCCAREFVAATLDVVVESVLADEHRVKLLYGLGLFCYASVVGNGACIGLNLHCQIVGLVGQNGVFKAYSLAQDSLEGSAQQVYVIFFEKLTDKMTLNLYVKRLVLVFERNDIREPSREYICGYIVAYNAQTVIPYCF